MIIVYNHLPSTSTMRYQSGLHWLTIVSSGSVQTFTAPVDGIYRLTCYGASGGGQDFYAIAGKGGITEAYFEFKTQDKINVYVGGAGFRGGLGNPGGWNGGGSAMSTATVDSSSGGGSTDFRIGSSLYNRILVAGAGGGICDYSSTDTAYWQIHGGAGGGFVGGSGETFRPISVPTGGTQYSGGGFGYGQSLSGLCRGGAGGAGWYGGYATMDFATGGGGSSYISGHPFCASLRSVGQCLSGYSSYTRAGCVDGNGRAYAYLIERK